MDNHEYSDDETVTINFTELEDISRLVDDIKEYMKDKGIVMLDSPNMVENLIEILEVDTSNNLTY